MAPQSLKHPEISRITLGTVQLGLDYGIANKTGKPDSNASFTILSEALQNGVTTFDTSPLYGNSEKVVGSFLSSITQNSKKKKIIVVTKIPPQAWRGTSSRAEIYEKMKGSVQTSLKILGLKVLPICLLHSATLSDLTDLNGVIVDQLLKLKEEGFIENIGASLYSPDEVKEILRKKTFNAIQVPINIFDNNLIKTNVLKDLNEHGIMVFARSIFLQGLFFLTNNEVPGNLQNAVKYLELLRTLSNNYKIPVNQLAFDFVRDLPGVSSVVIGVETRDQLLQNISLLNSPPLPEGMMQIILDTFSDIPEDIINPSKWKK